MGVVEVNKAVVGYADRQVLSGVDLTVESGQAVALLGANGSGKSTLVRTALGLVPLSAGSVRLFGSAVSAFRDWRRIGYVPQRFGASGGVPATVGEVVSTGRLARRRIPLPATANDRRVVAEAIEAVGLTDRVKDAVSTLSGGQQQRVLIARALATEPELLVMDEPTSGVDAANTTLLADLLSRRMAGGAAILLVAHELGPLAELIDRAIVLGNGRVIHDGPVPVTGDSSCHTDDPSAHGDLWSVALWTYSCTAS